MKQLLLIRHAKSSWDNIGQKDFDRPLNDRGHDDAQMMAKRLVERKVFIEAFISSPAKRALSTAIYFADAYKRKPDDITTIQSLYLPPADAFYNAVSAVDDGFDAIAVFSHNPGITAFANSLTSTQIDDMPTCSIFAVQANIHHWKDFDKEKKEFWFFDYPKMHK